MNTLHRTLVVATLALVSVHVAGCAAAPAEPSPPAADVASPLLKGDVVPGFQHTAARSRFAIGAAPAMRSELGLEKLVGTDGVISTRPRTGLVVAMPNADSPSRRKGPLQGAEPHNAAVRSYFVGAGLPEDQIFGVEIYATMSAAGRGDDVDTSRGQLDHYYSVISRQVNGVRVLDSFAWARMSADGEVVSESVYWPALSKRVVAQAVALREILADESTKQALIAKLPQAVEAPAEGHLFIRHTPGEWDGSFAAAASYDVGQNNRILHIRADGAEFQLPHEAMPPLTPSSPKRSAR